MVYFILFYLGIILFFVYINNIILIFFEYKNVTFYYGCGVVYKRFS